MPRCVSVRFSDVNHTVRFGYIFCPTVRFGAVFQYRETYGAVRFGFEKGKSPTVRFNAVNRTEPHRTDRKNRTVKNTCIVDLISVCTLFLVQTDRVYPFLVIALNNTTYIVYLVLDQLIITLTGSSSRELNQSQTFEPIVFAKIRFYKFTCLPQKKFPSHLTLYFTPFRRRIRKKTKKSFPPSFWCVCARGKQNPAGDAFETDKGNMGICATTIYAQQQQFYTMRVLVVGTPVSSLSFQMQHTWYLVLYMQAPNRLYKSKVRGFVSRVKTPCELGLPHYTYVLKAEQRLLHSKEEKAKRSFPWNVDPLRSTTLRGIRSARSGLGQRSCRSSALYRKSCHASVSVMLEKRGGRCRCGRCRTDGPIRVLSYQMRHTIAAIKAAWCRSRC